MKGMFHKKSAKETENILYHKDISGVLGNTASLIRQSLVHKVLDLGWA